MAGGGIPTDSPGVAGGYLTGKKLIYPLSLVISLFFLWGFSYGLLDVLNKHFQTVLGITKLESTGLQVCTAAHAAIVLVNVRPGCLLRWRLSFVLTHCS